MLKLIIKTAVANTPGIESAVSSFTSCGPGSSSCFMVTHANAQSSHARLTGPLSNKVSPPLEDLTRLLLMHPSFRKSSSLVDHIYTDMLDMIGLDAVTVGQIFESFSISELMIVSLETTDADRHCIIPANLMITGYFEVKLHNQFKSLIRKALINLVQLPGLRWERQIAA